MSTRDDRLRTMPSSSVRFRLALERETFRFALVSVLDIIMTYLVIHYSQQGHTSQMIGEGNPLPAFFIERWGMLGMILFKIVLVLFVIGISQLVHRFSRIKAQFMLNFGTVAVSFVVLYSLWLLLSSWSWE